MKKINTSLKSLMNEGEGNNELNYKVNIGGETFQVGVEMDKSGINVELVPVSPDGEMIYNLSEEEIKTLRNTLMTSLSPKFAKYKLELTSEDSNTETPSIKMNIPVGSIFPFLQNIMSR